MISIAGRNVDSDFYFAEHDRQQRKRDERNGRDTQKHADHEYRLIEFHALPPPTPRPSDASSVDYNRHATESPARVRGQ